MERCSWMASSTNLVKLMPRAAAWLLARRKISSSKRNVVCMTEICHLCCRVSRKRLASGPKPFPEQAFREAEEHVTCSHRESAVSL